MIAAMSNPQCLAMGPGPGNTWTVLNTFLRSWLILSFAVSSWTLDVRGDEPHPYRLRAVNLKDQVIWGSICGGPDGIALAFGGEDQEAEDGMGRTHLQVNGQWIDLEQELARANPLRDLVQDSWELSDSQRHTLAIARSIYLEGLPPEESRRRVLAQVVPRLQKQNSELQMMVRALRAKAVTVAGLEKSIDQFEFARIESDTVRQVLESGDISAGLLARLRHAQVLIETAGAPLCAEPPARALSPIAYEPKSKLFVLFGGDHCDYLTNDTWVFDPSTRRWSMRHPASAPPPRANHSWKVAGDGKLILGGGYTYFSNTDYMGGQYIDLKDGDWTYDVANNTWTGTGKLQSPDSRTYRTGPFLPEYFFDGPRPNASEFQAWLKALPPNVWTKTNPPQLPQINRDWGSAVIDPIHDLILRFSGGHCAHGGTDVLQYHLASNRWELCYPVEFPLGQLYTNTDYPNGFNFNHRPWVSGHTYQNYGFDLALKRMLFLGHPPFAYQYDPQRGDWVARSPVPKDMCYSGAMFTLTTTTTPQGLVCWTETGKLFRFDALLSRWLEIRTTGEPLPGSVVDNSTLVYDDKRDRLLFFRKLYGDSTTYDGEIFAVNLQSRQVSKLSPSGMAAASAISYLCQIRRDPAHDLLFAGATLPPGPDGLRRTPAYDCAANKWISLRITGNDPSGPKGRNVSLGLMYDAKRNLFWAVDAKSQVFVLHLEPASAGIADLSSAPAQAVLP